MKHIENLHKLLKLKAVMAATAKSRSAIYASMAKGTFPKNVKLGSSSSSAWVESEIQEWITEQMETRA